MSVPTLTVHGLEIPASVHTLQGFREWFAGLGEEGRISATYAGGEVFVEMNPQSYESHEPLVEEIDHVLASLARESGLGRYYRPPSWVTFGSVSTEPDGFLVRWERLERGEVAVHPERATELQGRPDMTLEAVSDTSARKDWVTLMRGYAREGVPEYWIADARAMELVFRIHVLVEGAYRALEPDDAGWITSPLWGRSFRLLRTRNPAGQPDFRLEVRA